MNTRGGFSKAFLVLALGVGSAVGAMDRPTEFKGTPGAGTLGTQGGGFEKPQKGNVLLASSVDEPPAGWAPHFRLPAAEALAEHGLTGKGWLELTNREGHCGPVLTIRPGDEFRFQLEAMPDGKARPARGRLYIGLYLLGSHEINQKYDPRWRAVWCNASLDHKDARLQSLDGTLVVPRNATQRWARILLTTNNHWHRTGSWYVRSLKVERTAVGEADRPRPRVCEVDEWGVIGARPGALGGAQELPLLGNLCSNPSMNRGQAGWSGEVGQMIAVALDPSLSRLGAVALFGKSAHFDPGLIVQPGEEYELKAQAWKDLGPGTGMAGGGPLVLGLSLRPAGIDSDPGSWINLPCEAELAPTVAGRQLYAGRVKVPEHLSACPAVIRLENRNDHALPGSWYLRNVFLGRVEGKGEPGSVKVCESKVAGLQSIRTWPLRVRPGGGFQLGTFQGKPRMPK